MFLKLFKISACQCWGISVCCCLSNIICVYKMICLKPISATIVLLRFVACPIDAGFLFAFCLLLRFVHKSYGGWGVCLTTIFSSQNFNTAKYGFQCLGFSFFLGDCSILLTKDNSCGTAHFAGSVGWEVFFQSVILFYLFSYDDALFVFLYYYHSDFAIFCLHGEGLVFLQYYPFFRSRSLLLISCF